MDACKTIERDCQKRADTKKSDQLYYSKRKEEREERTQRIAEEKKMQEMFDLYYDWHIEKKCEEVFNQDQKEKKERAQAIKA